MALESIVVLVLILVLSAILHEVAHGYAADSLGDPTARLAGRLTLNPAPHIDFFGSIVLPALLVLVHSPILFGYAKPVPYNPYNLKGKFGEAFVAAAGALTNFAIAIVLGLSLRFFAGEMLPAFAEVLTLAVYINLMLGLFNLIPLPPLDGSKVFAALLPGALAHRFEQFELRMAAMGPFSGFFLVLLVFWIFSPIFSVVLRGLFALLVGAPLQL